MEVADVGVIGGGIAGSLTALMLGRAGFRVCMIDPVRPTGSEFRSEKLEHAHLQALSHAGVLDDILPDAVRYDTIWIGRNGHLTEHRRALEFGIDYATLVNRMRALLPPNVTVLADKVIEAALQPANTRRHLQLASGAQLDARLVVLATGSNPDTLATFGYGRRIIRRCQSISIGFDLVPSNPRLAELGPLTWFGEHPHDRIAYLTIFPLPGRLRANLFVYRETDDPWLRAFRARPAATILDSLPGFARTIGPLEISGPVSLRPVDLVDTIVTPQSGVVLVGDAFRTACPVSGTGASKAMIDVERLCNVYAPKWLAGDVIGPAETAAFYRDREKRASDRHSRKVSLFARRMTLEEGGLWSAVRWFRGAASRSRHFIPRHEDLTLPAASSRPSAAH